jgi:hypothetical protein
MTLDFNTRASFMFFLGALVFIEQVILQALKIDPSELIIGAALALMGVSSMVAAVMGNGKAK